MRCVKVSEVELDSGVLSPLYLDLESIEYMQEHYCGYFDGEHYRNYTTIGMKSGKSFNITQDAKQIFTLAREDKEKAMQNRKAYTPSERY